MKNRVLASDGHVTAGSGVTDVESHSVQPGNRRDERETKPASRCVTACLGAVKSAQHEFALSGGNARPAVDDLKTDDAASGKAAQCDTAATRGEFQGVVHEIAGGLEQQAGIAAQDGRTAVEGKPECDALRLGHGFIELNSVGQHCREVRIGESGPARIAFHLGYPQYGTEGFQHVAGFQDGLVDRGGLFLWGAGAPAGPFQPREQPCQGRPQVMGDVVADALHLLHQALKLAQHAVDHVGQSVEIVGPPVRRQAFG